MEAAARVRQPVKLIRYAVEHGAFPVAGGTLDQTQNFMDSIDLWQSECALWEAHAKSEAAKAARYRRK